MPGNTGTEIWGEAGGLILRSSHTYPCIEAWPPTAFEALATPLDRLQTFSQEHYDLAQVLYADAFPVEADKEGRIVLPEMLVAHAGLSDQVVFMGQGRIFQIWEPTAAAARQKEARERARAREMTIPGAVAVAA